MTSGFILLFNIIIVCGRRHHHTSQRFCLLGCWGLVNNASVCTVCFSEIKDSRASKQVEHQIFSWPPRGFPCHLYCILGPTFLPPCSISLEGPPTWFSVETQPMVALPGYEQFWGIPIYKMGSLLRFSHHKKIVDWRTKYETGFEWEKRGEAAIMTQNQSCCRAPHKNYSRRNGTWPGGKSAPPLAGLALPQSGHSLVWCPPPIHLVCSLLSHSKVI